MRKQRINSGQMQSKIEKWSFENGRLIFNNSFFGKAEKKGKRCIYSERGTASRETLEISCYKRAGLTPANVIKYNGKWWAVGFSTESDNSLYIKAECGQCRIYECTLEKKKKVCDEMNTPSLVSGENIIFDGIFCEKYIRTTEEEHFFSEAAEYVLVFSDEIQIGLADTIVINGKKYTAREVHNGEYLKEAVIVYRGDM